MHFLTQAFKNLKGSYYTPKKIINFIQYSCIISNPPYEVNNNNADADITNILRNRTPTAKDMQ
jgi:hypothetical protein